MNGTSYLKVAFASGLLLSIAAGGSNCQAKTYTTCAGLCAGAPPCNESYDECVASCVAQEDKCARVGHPAAFLAYLTCTTDGGFGCNDAGQPVASALCGQEQADLVQCESETDAALDIPDGVFDADSPCAVAGNCNACCKDHHEAGARMYAALVTACACEPAACQSQCAKEACAGDAQMEPQANDPCDQCLSGVLSNLTADAGACVLPVTLQCNQTADCALFVNCGTQAGCIQ